MPNARRSALSRSVAQLVEHRSPKPAVGGSIPSGPVSGIGNRESARVELGSWEAESRTTQDCLAVSSRGLGHSPLKAGTRVRIPLPLLVRWVRFGVRGSTAV